MVHRPLPFDTCQSALGAVTARSLGGRRLNGARGHCTGQEHRSSGVSCRTLTAVATRAGSMGGASKGWATDEKDQTLCMDGYHRCRREYKGTPARQTRACRPPRCTCHEVRSRAHRPAALSWVRRSRSRPASAKRRRSLTAVNAQRPGAGRILTSVNACGPWQAKTTTPPSGTPPGPLAATSLAVCRGLKDRAPKESGPPASTPTRSRAAGPRLCRRNDDQLADGFKHSPGPPWRNTDRLRSSAPDATPPVASSAAWPKVRPTPTTHRRSCRRSRAVPPRAGRIGPRR